jgi:hypothetical protein
MALARSSHLRFPLSNHRLTLLSLIVLRRLMGRLNAISWVSQIRGRVLCLRLLAQRAGCLDSMRGALYFA